MRDGTTTEEYIYYNGGWVYLGNNDVDLSIFYTQKDVDSLLKEKADVTGEFSAISELDIQQLFNEE